MQNGDASHCQQDTENGKEKNADMKETTMANKSGEEEEEEEAEEEGALLSQSVSELMGVCSEVTQLYVNAPEDILVSQVYKHPFCLFLV